MQLINLTPHAVVIVGSGGEARTIPPSDQVARCSVETEQIATIDVGGLPVPVVRQRFGAISGLPSGTLGVAYITSAIVAQAVAQDVVQTRRQDIYVPAEPVRDGDGRIVACRALARI